MTNRTNPEQTPDMSGPTDEEVEEVARAIGDTISPNLRYDGSSLATKKACERAARAAIRALDEVRRK